MKLKEKEMLIEKKHQELDSKEEKCIKELDQLSGSERSLCDLLAALPMEILPGESDVLDCLSERWSGVDEALVKRIARLHDYLGTLENLKIERMKTLTSHQARLTALCAQLDFKLDDGKYAFCLRAESMGQLEALLHEVRSSDHRVISHSKCLSLQLDCKCEEQQTRVNVLVETLEKLYARLTKDDASPPKRSAAFILRQNTAETVRQVCPTCSYRLRCEVIFTLAREGNS